MSVLARRMLLGALLVFEIVLIGAAPARAAASSLVLEDITFLGEDGARPPVLFDVRPGVSGPTPLWPPHWVAAPSRSLPIVASRGARLQVRATLRCDDGPGGWFEVQVAGGGLALTSRSFEVLPGKKVEVALAAGPLPASVGEHCLELRWSARSASRRGEAFEALATTRHTFLITLRPLISHGVVYRPLVEWAVRVASGLDDDEEIARALIRRLPELGLHYGRPAWDIYAMLVAEGGMCGGFAQLFTELAGTHGILCEPYLFTLDRVRADGPATPWRAIDISSPGLGNEKPTFRFDAALVDSVYPRPRFFGASAPDDDVQWITGHAMYRFVAGDDGHCVNLLRSRGRVLLYDPSFGGGPYEGCVGDEGPSSPMAGAALRAFRQSYFDRTVDHLEGLVSARALDGTTASVPLDVRTALVPDRELPILWRPIGAGTARERKRRSRFEPVEPSPASDGIGSRAVDWREIRDELLSARSDPGSAEQERLAGLLSRRVPLTLRPGVPLPGVASPLELVQAAAIRRSLKVKDPRLRDLVDRLVSEAPTRYLESVRDR